MMKKLNRSGSDYIWSFVIYSLTYASFGYFVLGMTQTKTFYFYASLLLFGALSGFISCEIYERWDFNVFIIQGITAFIIIFVVALNFNALIAISGG